MSKRAFARAAALLGAAALSAGVLVAVASPAQAASLGTVTLSQTSGTLTDTPVFATAVTSAACPTGYGENASLRVGRPGGPYSNLTRALGGGGYDTAPVQFAADRSLTTALGGTTPGAGEWWVIVECFSLTAGRHADEFRTPIFVTGSAWSTSAQQPATPTTTAVAAAPSGSTALGQEVTLTATVAPSAAAGSVEFKRGASTVIGSAPVSGGTATLTTTTLPVGTHSITATFTPSGTDYLASTSAPVSYEITSDGPSGSQEVVADISQGAFTLAVAGNQAVLTGGAIGGTATGSLQKATVTDLRGTNAGWDLTGQMEDFNTAPATTPIGAENLTWTPAASKASGSGSVSAGTSANLGDTRILCSATQSTSAGVFDCGAGLSLSIPDSVAPGAYAATLTLTLA